MKLETLYKRTKTGAIQYWDISVDTALGGAQIRKESGQLGTDKPIVHTENITVGKNLGKSNETTPQQQAESQAQSDWTKKHDEGYKSLADLGITDHGTHVSAHGQDLCLEEMLGTMLPQFNTDASGNVKPMLATDWKKVKAVKYPCLLQPKLDGVRCLMVVSFNTSKDNPIIFLSRSGKEYSTLGHIAREVGNYCFTKGRNPVEFILDGEIYSDELTFQEIIAAVKKQRPESLKLKFRAYDVVNSDAQDKRWDDTKILVGNINSDHVNYVATWMVNDAIEVKAHHDTWVQEGFEGAMIRHLNGSYAQGQRSRDLLKVKAFDETEYLFKRWEKGLRDEDLIAVCETSYAVPFRAKMVGTVAEKKKLEQEAVTNDFMTIKHFGLTDDGLPRFPIGKGFRNYD